MYEVERLPDLIQMEKLCAMSSLLAALVSQHERLGAVSRDFSTELAATQAVVGHAQLLLQQSSLQVCQTEGTETPDEEPPVVPSEWHKRLLKSEPISLKIHRKETTAAAGCSSPGDDGLAGEESAGDEGDESSSAVSKGDLKPLPVFEEDQVAAMPRARLSRTSSGSDMSCTSFVEANAVQRNAVYRLQVRLGKTNVRGNVTAPQVYKAMTALGIYEYTEDMIEQWFSMLVMVYNDDRRQRKGGGCLCRAFRRVWQGRDTPSDDVSARSYSGMRFRAFTDAILDDEVLNDMGADYWMMSLTIREALFSGDANRLVAELTEVPIVEVAAPVAKPSIVSRMEPFVAVLIFMNGIFIGAQTSRVDKEVGDGWFWGNAVFTLLMLIELSIRVAHSGLRGFFFSFDRWWNLFDILMIVIALCDIAIEVLASGAQVAPLSLLRVVRLTRLTRLVRIFRLRAMKELNLMVRGLIGGLYTLFWAVVLLFFTLYIIAVLSTATIGQSELVPEVVADELFSSVPRSVLTAFRCYMGDCNTSGGKPIIKLLSDAYGPAFIVCYFASTVFIIFGLFNLIVAIYVENTMSAAKTDGEKSAEELRRDTINVAKKTRQLLKKFCTAQRMWSSHRGGPGNPLDATTRERRKALRSSTLDDVEEESMQISKELYMWVIQDASVQKLMDDLDIPRDRAHLYDILDADCSGGLGVSELITSLLRVRGEAKKSDVVGTLLAVRVVQDLVREQNEHLVDLQHQLQQVKQP